MPPTTNRSRLLQSVKRSRFLNYIRRAFRSAAYPLQGVWYCLHHREFWPLFRGRLLPLSIISLLVYLVLFTFAFLPQYAFLAIWQGWGAWVNAAVLTLGEGLIIIQALFEGFFVDEARVDLFDATLINHSLTDLVAPHRLIFPDAPNSVKMLGKPTSRAEYSPWSIKQLLELVVYLPLNFIPVVGVPAYIIITGARLGKLSHHRWFTLRGLSRREKKAEIKKREWEYTWFGTVAMILELVPVLSLFFLLTTTAGSAIWACRLERDARGLSSTSEGGAEEGRAGQVEGHREGQPPAAIQEDEAPPPYSDDPL